MSTDWIIVSSDGFEVEDVLDPRSVIDTCPACEKRVRLLERELTRNFKIFKIPLLAVERGSRVFQCPHCSACFEPPVLSDPEARTAIIARSPELEARLKALAEQETRASDEVSLWRLRVELARRRGEHQMAHEALAMVASMEESLRALRSRIAELDGSSVPDVAEAVEAPEKPEKPVAVPVPRPPSPPEKTPEPSAREVDDEMEALKRRIRAGGNPPMATSPVALGVALPAEPTETPAAPPAPPPEPPDELSDLKKLLRKRD